MAQGTRRGLGRGLGSLIPTTPPPADPSTAEDDASGPGAPQPSGSGSAAAAGPSPTPTPAGERAEGGDAPPATAVPAGAYFTELPADRIAPNHAQPRQVFEEEALAELVASIREVGLLQPIVVRPVDDGRFELIMGERRWRAAQQAGLDLIPTIVRSTDDADMLRDALLENLHRAQLNPLEEASAYAQLLEDFACTHDELASRIGRSRPQISNTIRLLRLSPAVQRRVAAGVLSAGHARALLALDDADAQDRLAARVVAEGISVRGLEELVAVGDTTTPERPVARRRPVAPGLSDLADRLSERLETRAKVDLGRRKGKVTIEFASLDDLRRIVDIIDPTDG